MTCWFQSPKRAGDLTKSHTATSVAFIASLFTTCPLHVPQEAGKPNPNITNAVNTPRDLTFGLWGFTCKHLPLWVTPWQLPHLLPALPQGLRAAPELRLRRLWEPSLCFKMFVFYYGERAQWIQGPRLSSCLLHPQQASWQEEPGRFWNLWCWV